MNPVKRYLALNPSHDNKLSMMLSLFGLLYGLLAIVFVFTEHLLLWGIFLTVSICCNICSAVLSRKQNKELKAKRKELEQPPW